MLRMRLACAALIVVALGGCSAADNTDGAAPAPYDSVRSTLERETTSAAPAELAALVAGNTAFAFDLYRLLASGEGNLAVSPHGISVALAMLEAGAREETRSQILTALRFAADEDALHRGMNTLDLALATRGRDARGRDGTPFRLQVLNALWLRAGHPLKQPYLDRLARHYGTPVRRLDFAEAPEAARSAINQWVATQTAQRIPALLPAGSITPLTRLVLTNAVHFDAAWATPFAEEATAPALFQPLAGEPREVPTMVAERTLGLAEHYGITAVELPYDGGEVSMVLMQSQDGLAVLESQLTAERWAALSAGFAPARVRLFLPRFSSRATLDLVPALRELGMRDAFTASAADLSGIDGKRDLYVSGVVHQAVVDVDERGTEASAATAVIIGVTAIPEPARELRFDRPFVYLIRDNATGAILFMGRVADPGA